MQSVSQNQTKQRYLNIRQLRRTATLSMLWMFIATLTVKCSEAPPPSNTPNTGSLSSVSDGPPTIVSQPPASVDGYVGQSATIVVTVSCPSNCVYSWAKNGTKINGSTSQVLTLNNLALSDAGPYVLTVQNSFGTAVATASALNVFQSTAGNSAPLITAHPQSRSVNVGASAVFSVTASGMPAPTFQWLKNGTAVAGATTATLAIASVAQADAGSYSVQVANSHGSATSQAATLTVGTPTSGCSAGQFPQGTPNFEAQGLMQNSTMMATIPMGDHLVIILPQWAGSYGTCSAQFQCQSGKWVWITGQCPSAPVYDPGPSYGTGGGGG